METETADMSESTSTSSAVASPHLTGTQFVGKRDRGRGRGGRGAHRTSSSRPVTSVGWANVASTPTIREFHEQSGPQINLAYDSDHIEFLNLLLGGAQFWENMAINTNKNAAFKKPPRPAAGVSGPDGAGDQYPTSDVNWSPTDGEEMKCFIGINILGIHNLPEYRDYWSSDLALNVPYVSKKMSRHRYEKLCEYFHCSDPNNYIQEDKLHKVRPLLDVVGECFRKFYKPGCALSIDEAMIKFDGRLSWKQYMPKKPTKWGIKLWCLCDSVTGYCLKFDVYRGASDAKDDMSLSYRTIMSLMQPYLLSYHHLFAELSSSVCRQLFFFSGTCRAFA